MKKGTIIALILAITACLFAFLLFGKGKNGSDDEYKKVIVAASDISIGSKISEKDLAVQKIPNKYVLKGSITDIKDAAGKIAGVDIKKNEQITKDKAIAEGDKAGDLAYRVPKDKRAISFRINDEANLDGNLKPGNKVDVIVTQPVFTDAAQFKIQMGDSINTDIENGLLGFKSKYLVENVEVLYVGQDVVNDGTVNVTGESKDGTQVKASSAIVVLAVTPKDALVLNTEKYKADVLFGRFKLLLRGFGAEDKADPKEYSVDLLK